MENIIVTHKLTGERMKVKKVNGDIFTCWIDKPYYLNGSWVLVDVAICHKDNLMLN